MLVSKKDRLAVYTYLFKEGVLVCPKSFKGEKSLGKDADDKEIVVKTLFVIKMLQSLESRGLVRSTFCWQWFYYYLTDDGVAYLRTFLNLPAEIVPLTFKKTATSRPRTTDVRGDRPRFEGQRREGGDRPRFRRDGDKKDVGPGEGFKPHFRAEA